MGTMIPYDSIFMKAMDQSKAIDSNVKPPFHPGLYVSTPQPEGNVGRAQAMNTEYFDLGARDSMAERNLGGMQGGEGGAVRSMPFYTPGSGEGYTFPSETEAAPDTTMNLSPVHVGGMNTEQPAPQQGGIDEQKNAIEQVAQYGDIPQLLEALKDMASMEPGQGNPVFQLDAAYKQSSALGGLPGTVAQYPTAGGMTRETEYFF